MRHNALYAAFDRVPSAKGAAMHIAHSMNALGRATGGALLVCAADGELPMSECEGSLEVRRFGAGGAGFVGRIRDYQAGLAATLQAHRKSLRLCHFRDPWSGIPILEACGSWKTVYEVNGLPSVELPYRYPRLTARTLERVRSMETQCLKHADFILTPAATIARNLEARGVGRERITVIPNGADLIERTGRPPGAPDRYVLYFGALQPWQGVVHAIAALPLLADTGLTLVICSAHPDSVGLALKERAEKLGVAARIVWRHELTRAELAPWIAHALAALAPLTESARNLEQGCCPLKVLEAMAAGTPVIASDIAPVRELVAHREHGLLVRAGRPELIARAIRELDDDPALRRALGICALERVRANYTWEAIERRTERWYRDAVLAQGEQR
jgi:glycosyltransferase involved in cell wall biosynthesis